MIDKKVIVCDLDGTLAVSKSQLSPQMAEVLSKVLSKRYLAVVSGGSFEQFQKQFLSGMPQDPEVLKNLYLFPTMGSVGYSYNAEKKEWQKLYDDSLSTEERKDIINALNKMIEEHNLDTSGSFGDVIEDRGGQVTFSALGQKAPIEKKEVWDPDQKKRIEMVKTLKNLIPNFQISMGGTTSIDITKKGLDKSYAIGKIKNILNVSDEDIMFVGDALYKGGNDEAVKNTNVDFIQESGPDKTLEFLQQYA